MMLCLVVFYAGLLYFYVACNGLKHMEKYYKNVATNLNLL